MVLKRPHGACSLEDAKTKGLVTVEQDSLRQLLLIFRESSKAPTAGVLLGMLEWTPLPSSQARCSDPAPGETEEGEMVGQL